MSRGWRPAIRRRGLTSAPETAPRAFQPIQADAPTTLRELAAGSQDLVASAYAVHNFLEGYRDRVISEIFRSLRPSAIFFNGDRDGLISFAR
jgi:tRNA (cmo5U34)-methyltransferase